jgi:hypothetical protein
MRAQPVAVKFPAHFLDAGLGFHDGGGFRLNLAEQLLYGNERRVVGLLGIHVGIECRQRLESRDGNAARRAYAGRALAEFQYVKLVWIVLQFFAGLGLDGAGHLARGGILSLRNVARISRRSFPASAGR